MATRNYHTVFFQPVGNDDYTFTPIRSNNIRRNQLRSHLTYKINEYFFRGLAYIQYILKLIISSSPFIEQYSPVIRELPKMYTLVKAFKEIQDSEPKNDETEVANNFYVRENTFKHNESVPKLFF